MCRVYELSHDGVKYVDICTYMTVHLISDPYSRDSSPCHALASQGPCRVLPLARALTVRGGPRPDSNGLDCPGPHHGGNRRMAGPEGRAGPALSSGPDKPVSHGPLRGRPQALHDLLNVYTFC